VPAYPGDRLNLEQYLASRLGRDGAAQRPNNAARVPQDQ
jgi:hypothetical protein